MRIPRTARVLVATGAVFALAACGDDDPAAPNGGGNGGSEPAAVAVVSGDAQAGKTLEALADPLVVLVTDADGDPVAGATVGWTVATGGGTLSDASTTTDAQGRASVTFTPGATLGTSTIAAGVSGVATPAEFTIETTVMLIRMQNTAFVAPGGGDAVTVPVGTTVEWVNLDAVQHTATSTDAPAGGASFDSGLMGAGARFQFTPQVAGTWTYLCEVHPAIMVGATITATDGGNGGGGGAEATAVAVVSGDGQSGKTLEELGAPFVVLVTDADADPVSGATVDWSVTSGGGTLSDASTTTDAQGEASVTFTPGSTLGTSTVTAGVAGVATPAEFTVETTILLIRMENTAFVAPDGSDDATVPVGTTVEWVNLDGIQHTATTTDVPAGGASFDSGLLASGGRFQFTPAVAGTWTYLCEVHPGIMAGATLTAN
ncbi:MAG: Ig-like domain-containing protein [Gemmatimonadota bacterium]